MQVGISQLVLGGLPTAEFFEQSARAGYEVVELALTRDRALTLQTPDSDLHEYARRAVDHGLSLVSMTQTHCTGNLLATGQAQRTGIDETIRGLEIAAKLGIRCTLHTLGGLNADLYYDDAYRNGVASLKELAVT